MATQLPVQSGIRILSLIEALSRCGYAGITELARMTGLNKATVYRLISTLAEQNYVRQDKKTEKYYLTYKLLAIADRIKDHMDLRAMVRPHLERLCEKSGETVHFVVREGADIVYIDKVESLQNTFRMVSRIGLRHLAFSTGVGKAILAHLPDEKLRALWESAEIRHLTPNTITDFDAFIAEINEIRAAGYAVDREENELGVFCVAVALRDHTGAVNNAFSISSPASRMTPDRTAELARMLLRTQAEILAETDG